MTEKYPLMLTVTDFHFISIIWERDWEGGYVGSKLRLFHTCITHLLMDSVTQGRFLVPFISMKPSLWFSKRNISLFILVSIF